MISTIQNSAGFITQTAYAVAHTLGKNSFVLFLAVIAAVVLKTYFNGEKIATALSRHTKVSTYASVAAGTFTPFCACGTMAIIVGMLSTSLPWGPIMAFLTSSPLMSPNSFILLTGVIGLEFAMALIVSSLTIGLTAGFISNAIESKSSFLHGQIRFSAVEKTDSPACSQTASCACSCSSFTSKLKLKKLGKTFIDVGIKQILFNFTLFITIGSIIQQLVPEHIIVFLFGSHNFAAVPLACIIGLPMYITTEASIPLVQSMLNSGASNGAMLAFMISGAGTSAFVIAGLSSFLKGRALALYVAFIVFGSIFSGYFYDFMKIF